MSDDTVGQQFSPEYHAGRARAHRKWARVHLFLTGFGMMTIVGLVWAPLTLLKWRGHRKQAVKHENAVKATTGKTANAGGA